MINMKCPHCERDVTIVSEKQSTSAHTVHFKNADGQKTLYSQWVVCPNNNCRKATLTIWVKPTTGHQAFLEPVQGSSVEIFRRVIPRSQARTFPDYVPAPIREDYEEACAIKEDSPKAAATLARRALQGIIRDFYRVKPGRLYDEIEALKDKIDEDIYESIDTVRRVGNIGAHMEKDINVIVEVDEGEATLLIELVETLIEDCYIARHKKQEKLARLKALGTKKDEQRKQGRQKSSAMQKQAIPTAKDPKTSGNSD
jgi:hypothetical protein